MPRGQKSTLHAREKCQQTRGQTQDHQGAQITATNKKKVSFSSPLILGPTIQKKSAGRPGSALKKPQRALATTTSVDVSYKKSYKGANSKIKKKQSFSQGLSSTVRSRTDPLTMKTNMLVQFLMEMYKMKKPIMEADMLKIVQKSHENRFPEILKKAAFNMEVVFGVDLKKVDSTKDSYVLVSKMDLPNNGTVTRGRGFPKTGLLLNLLGVIFMKGNCATEEKIWEFLNKMRIYDGKKHFIFGEPRKLITQDLVKLKYLEYRQVPNSNPARYEFLWGPRAHAETSKMKVLEFWAKVNQTVPSAFQFWYEEALRDEEERVQATAMLNDGSSAMGRKRSKAKASSSSHA
ncbi:melanoma-associated antigen B3 [Pongo pygmaeus]|uniref:MAGE family member B3 n=1 Tax=Pongo abelii TaxID=9601 RepID=A0A2J8WJ50_PONAB|nr:melanoma-associated antigen B3 [Pongo pygmaeus]XP_054327838.1 melanoma-associated antigen B3 [Pongo pygmaeus]PNJ69808.1 MAGEB3 isoform 1 [Pongo abelii]PNJ69809.1 MAGEB3 isoform 2 [Pongo abelii]